MNDKHIPNESQNNFRSFENIRAGLLFIIAGSLIYASQEGLIDQWFWWFLLSWGAILLLQVVVCLNIRCYKASIVSPLIWGTILVGFSVHQLYGLEEWWPMALIAIGTGIILHGMYRSNV